MNNIEFGIKCTDSANLKMKKIIRDTDDGVAQSMCYLPSENSLVVCYSRADGISVTMEKISLSSLEVTNTVNNLPYYHANDITYNSNNNKLYLIPMTQGIIPAINNKIFVLNSSTFQKEGEIVIADSTLEIAGIAYDDDNDKYYLNTSSGILVLNSTFSIIDSFDESYNINLGTNQTLEFYDGRIYVVHNNKVVVYDSDGNYVKHFTTLGKLESEAFASVGNGSFLLTKILNITSSIFVNQLYEFNIYDFKSEGDNTFYTDVSQIGIVNNNSINLMDICKKMPNNSAIQFDANTINSSLFKSSLPGNCYGNIFIRKTNQTRIQLEYSIGSSENNNPCYYVAKYHIPNDTTIVWKRVVLEGVQETQATLDNGATVLSGINHIRKNGNTVTCHLCLKNISQLDSTIYAIIPKNYTPSHYLRVIGAASGANFARFEIDTSGNVRILFSSISNPTLTTWYELFVTYLVN